MFNCMSDVYKNILNNMSDFKELIPEFYDVDNNGEFLVNNQNINFGCRHDGTKVRDVVLPPWASDEKDFIRKFRQALESEYVSENLNHWIDLIFGYKQIGIEAEKADNVFYYLCYEGSVDLDSIKELSDRHALEVQIMEFGQIPKQLFKRPHVKKLSAIPPQMTLPDQNITSRKVRLFKDLENLKELHVFQSHKDKVSKVLISTDGKNVISVGHDSLLKMYSIDMKRQVRSVAIGTMPLSSCLQMSDGKTLLIGSWDNSIVLYDLEYGRIMQSIQAHDDAISCLTFSGAAAISKSDSLLVSGSWDCSIRIWKGIKPDSPIKHYQNLLKEIDHESHVTCVALSHDDKSVITGTQDGSVFLLKTFDTCGMQLLHRHRAVVNSVSMSPDCSKMASCSDDESFAVVDLMTGMMIFERRHEEALCCSLWKGNLLIIGGNCGNLYIWDMLNVEIIKKISVHKGLVSSVAVSDNFDMIVTGGEDNTVRLWTTNPKTS